MELELLVKNVRVFENLCDGCCVYMYDLLFIMNIDIFKNCSGNFVKWLNFCLYYKNYGFGVVVNVIVEVFC